jgi:hypothetical protein
MQYNTVHQMASPHCNSIKNAHWGFLLLILLLGLCNLALGADINPVLKKFITVPDKDMPGYPEWSVLAKKNLSSWDDGNWVLSSTEPMSGMFPVNHGLSNGCVSHSSVRAPNFTACWKASVSTRYVFYP